MSEAKLKSIPGFVISYIDGDGQTFDYGIGYTECANSKLLRAQGALELAPYISARQTRLRVNCQAGDLLEQ